MNRVKGFQNLQKQEGCVLSIGNFDGVHRGHQAILSALVLHAKRLSIPSIVLTFEPHPATLLTPDRRPPRLTTPEKKAELIAELGVDTILEYATDWGLLNLGPKEFFEEIVLNQLQATGLVEGPNFFFGKNRAGNGDTLRDYCLYSGRFLEIVPPTLLDDTIVSSSQVRAAITAGEIQRATLLLGRNYEIQGIVGTGAQRGRTLGFPTANLEQIGTQIPAHGVYVAHARCAAGKFPAAVSIGPNPTFGENTSKVEAHLLDACLDIYGQTLQLEFVERLRGLQQFSSVEELQTRISNDITATRSVLDARSTH